MDGIGNGNVLIVDDEPNAVRVLSAILTENGYEVLESGSVEEATRLIGKKDIDAVITELRLPDGDGAQLYEYVNENHPHVPVIFLTAYGTVDSAVSAMSRGVFYYFIKPPDFAKLVSILAKAVEQCRLRKEVETLRKKGIFRCKLRLIPQISECERNIPTCCECLRTPRFVFETTSVECAGFGGVRAGFFAGNRFAHDDARAIVRVASAGEPVQRRRRLIEGAADHDGRGVSWFRVSGLRMRLSPRCCLREAAPPPMEARRKVRRSARGVRTKGPLDFGEIMP